MNADKGIKMIGFNKITNELTIIKRTALILTTFLFANTAIADEFLSTDQLKALFTNQSFDINVVARDMNLQGYDSADGVHLVYVPTTGKTAKRKWWIENNTHCVDHPKYGVKCKSIKPVGNGVYHGITEGKLTHRLSNFRAGKSFNK